MYNKAPLSGLEPGMLQLHTLPDTPALFILYFQGFLVECRQVRMSGIMTGFLCLQEQTEAPWYQGVFDKSFCEPLLHFYICGMQTFPFLPSVQTLSFISAFFFEFLAFLLRLFIWKLKMCLRTAGWNQSYMFNCGVQL